jgi:type IV pilus assembly protein PilY1
MSIKTIYRAFLLAASGSALALTTLAIADDTDVYLGTGGVVSSGAPDILIIFDNSISMGENIATHAEAYDPSTDYSSLGNFNKDTIYWSNSGVPADSYYGRQRSFSASHNQCASSVTPLATTGAYVGAKVLRWRPPVNGRFFNLPGKWLSLTQNNDPDYVDCEQDVVNADPGPAPANLGYPKNGNSGPYTSNVNNSDVSWDSYDAVNLYTGNYLNWHYHSPGVQTREKLAVAKEVVSDLIQSNPDLRFGLMTFNYQNGGRVISNVGSGDEHISSLVSAVNSLDNDNFTPLSETLWEAYRYFAGKGIDYGHSDSNPSPPWDQSAEDGEGHYVSPFQAACEQAYVILMTDGAPTRDQGADGDIEALPGIVLTGDGNHCDAKEIGDTDGIGPETPDDGICLDDLAGWMYDNDVYDGRDGTQRIVTYTIGFAVDHSLLKETATAGHGKYVKASDANELTNAFHSIVAEIVSRTTSFAAPSVSVNAFNKLFNRDAVYFALFKPDTRDRWDGNIKKYRLCSADEINAGTCLRGDIIDKNDDVAIDPATYRLKDTACSFWTSSCPDGSEVPKGGAGSQIPDPADRRIFTYTGASEPSNVTLDTADQRVNAANSNLTLETFGLDPSGDAVEDATARDNLIKWIRGEDPYDQNDDGNTAKREWRFGDPLHSRPLAITYGPESTQKTYLFVGTNHGDLRAIDDDTGEEKWMFIAPEFLTLQPDLLTNADSGTDGHPYGLDGTATAWINDVDGDTEIDTADGDFVYLYIGMRRGGNNYYAFNITDPENPILMWRIKGGIAGTDFAKLGQTWSRPIITRIRTFKETKDGVDQHSGTTVLMFAGGYHDAQDAGWGPDDDADSTGVGTGNAIYIVNAKTGARIWWASGPKSGANLELDNMLFSIPSDLALIDGNGDGETDRIYVGDTGAQLWRIDLEPTLGKTNKTQGANGVLLATLADSDGITTPNDNRKFFYPPDIAQVTDTAFTDISEGTNPTYDAVTITSGNRSNPNGTDVHDRAYMIRDYRTDPLDADSVSSFTTRTESDLADLTAAAGTLNDLKAKHGWYLDLRKEGAETTDSWIGEKGLSSTLILDGVLYFTTFVPTQPDAEDICTPQEGTGQLYAVNLFNAAAVFDLNSSGGEPTTADRSMKLGAGIPSELVPVFQETGVAALVGVGGGAVRFDPDIELPRERTFWFQE